MNKEDILKMSREEHVYGYDERDAYASGKASRVGLAVGGLMCMILVVLSEFVFHDGKIALAGWMMYLGMFGTQQLVLFYHLRKKSDLIFGIIDVVVAIVAMMLLFK